MSKYSLILSPPFNTDDSIDHIVGYIMENFEYSDTILNYDQIKFKLNIGLLIRSVWVDTEEMTCVVDLELEEDEDDYINISKLKSILREEKIDNLLND